MKQKQDLNAVIGSKKAAAWARLKEDTENSLMQGEIAALINKAIIELAEKEIEKEKIYKV